MNRKTAFILIASCFLVCIAPCIHAENSSLVNTRVAYEKSLQSVESNYEDVLQAALCQ